MKTMLLFVLAISLSLVACVNSNGDPLLLVEVQNGITYFNPKDLSLLNEIFSGGTDFNEGFGAVRIGKNWYILSSGGEKRKVNRVRQMWSPRNGIFRFQEENDTYGFFSSTGNIIAKGLGNAEDFSNGYALIKQKAKYNYINTNGELLLRDWCVAGTSFYSNVAIIKKRVNGKLKTVLINNYGTEIFDFSEGNPLMSNYGSDLFLLDYDFGNNRSSIKYINYKTGFTIRNADFSTGTVFSENRAFVLIGDFVVISAVVARISKVRAAAIFVDNAAHVIYGQRYFSGNDLDKTMAGFVSGCLLTSCHWHCLFGLVDR